MSNSFKINYTREIHSDCIKESLAAGRLSTDYDFTGAKTVKVVTPLTVLMNDYTKTGANRYGEPVEMKDIVQELTLTQDKSFALTIDKGNQVDKDGKNLAMMEFARKMLLLQMSERAVPEFDRYIFDVLSRKAGIIKGNTAALSKTNIVERITDGGVMLDNAEIPQSDRTLFITPEGYKLLKLSDEFIGSEKLAEKSLIKGIVGEFDNMAVIKVPKNRWPINVNFMIVYKKSATAPTKIHDAKLHQDPPGISGNLLEGRNYYDCFVIASKASGVYVDLDTAQGKAVICETPSIAASTGAITCATSGAIFKYTTDGSDPRYSANAVVGQPTGVTAGTIIKAYAYKNGCFDSAVAEKTM